MRTRSTTSNSISSQPAPAARCACRLLGRRQGVEGPLRPACAGRYEFRSVCTDASDSGLHGQTWTLEAVAYRGDNPLLAHGRLRISENRRHFQHADGTPFCGWPRTGGWAS